jgi:hypothetical protein
MSLRRVAILGAAGSGKSWLAQALSQALLAYGDSVRVTDKLGAPPPSSIDGPRLAPVDWWITEAAMPSPVSDLGGITLLMGLDLPGLGPEHQKEDSLLRQALSSTPAPFKIVYGVGVERLNNALLALGMTGVNTAAWQDRERSQFNINGGQDAWVCNDCSDPACEHKLFTRLLTQRAV